MITTQEVRTDGSLFELWNMIAENHIVGQTTDLVDAIQGANIQIALVPAIYLGESLLGTHGVFAERPAFAFAPGLVNLQDWNGQFWLPKPFGPRLGGVDVFESAVVAELGPPGITAFLDNWDIYHRKEGEVHCGTNVIRTPSGNYLNWWDHLP